MAVERYIGDSKLVNRPQKKLSLVLKDGSVTHSKIADDAVETDNIKDKTVTSDKLADASISIQKMNALLVNMIMAGTGLDDELIQEMETFRDRLTALEGAETEFEIWQLETNSPEDDSPIIWSDVRMPSKNWSLLERARHTDDIVIFPNGVSYRFVQREGEYYWIVFSDRYLLDNTKKLKDIFLVNNNNADYWFGEPELDNMAPIDAVNIRSAVVLTPELMESGGKFYDKRTFNLPYVRFYNGDIQYDRGGTRVLGDDGYIWRPLQLNELRSLVGKKIRIYNNTIADVAVVGLFIMAGSEEGYNVYSHTIESGRYLNLECKSKQYVLEDPDDQYEMIYWEVSYGGQVVEETESGWSYESEE